MNRSQEANQPGEPWPSAAIDEMLRLQAENAELKTKDVSRRAQRIDAGQIMVSAAVEIDKANAAHDEIESAMAENAIRDPLTGLYNKTLRGMIEEACALDEEPFAIIALDLNNFKGVNDSLGHDAGDRVLTAIGRILTSSLRTQPSAEISANRSLKRNGVNPSRGNDYIARALLEKDSDLNTQFEDTILEIDHEAYREGGDEFTVVSFGVTEQEQVDQIQIRIQTAFKIWLNELRDGDNVENHDFATRLEEIGLGISMGSCIYQPGMSLSAADIIKTADEQLAMNKFKQKIDLMDSRLTDEDLDRLEEAGMIRYKFDPRLAETDLRLIAAVRHRRASNKLGISQ